jgi:hypothetical protein
LVRVPENNGLHTKPGRLFPRDTFFARYVTFAQQSADSSRAGCLQVSIFGATAENAAGSASESRAAAESGSRKPQSSGMAAR